MSLFKIYIFPFDWRLLHLTKLGASASLSLLARNDI